MSSLSHNRLSQWQHKIGNNKSSIFPVTKVNVDCNITMGEDDSVAKSRSPKAYIVPTNGGHESNPLQISVNNFDEISRKSGQTFVNNIYVKFPKNDKQPCWSMGNVDR